MIQVKAVGGYGEVGRNMTAIRVDEDVVLIDMGLHLPNYITITEAEEREDVAKIDTETLRKGNAIPDDCCLDDWRPLVKAIVPTHAHLDHVGAVPYLAGHYKAPIYCTPFTAAVLRNILRDEKMSLPNRIVTMKGGARVRLSKTLEMEFISMPHSTPQTVIVALHTKHGIVLYATDWKLDNNPVIGDKPDYNALRRIGQKSVLVAFLDGLYAHEHAKTPSESVVRELLKDTMLGIDNRGKAIIVTTFASQIARLKSIMDWGRSLNRKVLFLGRSVAKYSYAAEEVGLVNFSKQVKIVKYGAQARKELARVAKEGKHKYVLVVSGNQGEPQSMLVKIARKQVAFPLGPEDQVVFSCKVIPTEPNMSNRRALEDDLKAEGVRVFTDIHASGHPMREDLREFIRMVKPKHIIPMHCEHEKEDALLTLAVEMGYHPSHVHTLRDGQTLDLHKC